MTILSTIVYDNSGGSDVLASGAGPSTAITGSSATNGAGNVVNLDGSPDLSGVAVNDILYATTPVGSRKLSRITAVDDGADTVTTEDLLTLGGGVTWAIGGKRKTLDADTSRPDVLDMKKNWRLSLEGNGSSPHYTLASASLPMVVPGDTGTEEMKEIVAASGHTPVVAWTSNTALFTMSVANSWLYVNGVTFSNTTSTNTAATCFNLSGTGVLLQLQGVTTSQSGRSVLGTTSTSTTKLMAYGCDFTSTHTQGLAGNSGLAFWSIRNCIIHDCGSSGIQMSWAQGRCSLVVEKCVIRDNLTFGVLWNQDRNSNNVVCSQNVIHGNGSDGIRLFNSSVRNCGPHCIEGNILTSNGGYGIKADSGFVFGRCWLDFNAYLSNSSGEVNGFTRTSRTGEGGNDVTLTAEPYFNEPGNDFTLNGTAGGGAACRDAGYGYDG